MKGNNKPLTDQMLPHESLDKEIASQSIEVLSLAPSIIEVLNSFNLKTIGDIYDYQADGIAAVFDIEQRIVDEVWQKTVNFVSEPSSLYHTISYLDKPTLPDTDQRSEIRALIDLAAILPSFVEDFFEELNSPRVYRILRHRYGLRNEKIYTLEELGAFYEVTRERIRQIQNKGVKDLTKAILKGEVRKNAFNIDRRMVSESNEIKYVIETGAPIQLDDHIFDLIGERYSREISVDEKAHLRLFFDGWGWKEYTSLQNVDSNPFWLINPEEISVRRINQCSRSLLRLLHNEVKYMPYIDLKIELNKKAKTKYSDLEVRTSLLVSADVEAIEDDNYQVKINKLSSIAQQAYRVLSENGSPMGFRDIYQEIGVQLGRFKETPVGLRSMTNQLASDDRFTAIGRSGDWALSEWTDIVQDTIVELMEEFFLQHGKAARAGEVYEYVSTKRPVSRGSIDAYLADKAEFVRVGRGLYSLASLTPTTAIQKSSGRRRWTWQEVAEKIIQIFDEDGVEEMPLSDLAIKLKNTMGRSTVPYASLQKSPAIEITVDQNSPSGKKATLIRNYLELVDPNKLTTLRERVHDAIREELKNQPDHAMQMTLLKQKIMKKTGVKGPTFYSYLSEMIDVQKAPIPDTSTYMCVLVGYETDETIEEISDIWDTQFVYDIAISYAGEQREIAKRFFEALKAKRHSSFYDRAQLPDLVGRNLRDDLVEIYQNKAHLCVILVSEAYNASKIAQIERQAAQAREIKDDGYIVYIKLESNVAVRGMIDTEAYLDYRTYEFDDLVDIVCDKLKRRKQ